LPLAQTRKDVAQVFCGLLRRTSDGPQPCIDYLLKHTQLLGTLIDGRVACPRFLPRAQR
jgi:hypothetical protein